MGFSVLNWIRHIATLDDAIPMFKSNNRYRDVIASPEGNTLYVLTDTARNVQKMMVQSLIL